MAIRNSMRPNKVRAMKTGSTKWLNNAMKSVGLATNDALKEIAPNLHEAVSSGVTVSKDISRSIRGNRQGSANIQGALEQNKYVKFFGTAVKNTIKDIKNGTFVNPDAYLNDEEFDSSAEWENSDNGGVTNINIDNSAMVKATADLSKQFAANSVANIKMQKATMDAYLSTSAISMQQIGEIGTQVVSELQNVNSNLSALVQYHNDNMSKFINASLAYYEKTGSMAEKQKEDDKIAASDVFNNKHGGINYAKYKDYVKQQIKSMADSSMVGPLMAIIDDENTLKMLAANPMGFMASGVVKYMMPKLFMTTIQGLEATYSTMVPKILADVGKWAETEGATLKDRVKRAIGKSFGLRDEDEKYKMANKASINYEAIPFDGETKHAITEVITKELNLQTGYLSIIASHYKKNAKSEVEKNRQFWDKRTNSYVTREGVDKTIAESISRAISSSFSDTGFGKQMDHLVSKQDDSVKESMKYAIDELYFAISRSKQKLTLEELTNIISNMRASGTEKKVIKDFVEKMAKEDKLAFNSLERGRLSSYKNGRNALKNIAENASSYHFFDSSFNNEDIDDYDMVARVRRFGNGDIKNKEVQKAYDSDNKRFGERVHVKGTKKSNLDSNLDSYKYSNMNFGKFGNLKDDAKTVAGTIGKTISNIFKGATIDVAVADIFEGAKEVGGRFLEKNKPLFDEVKNNFVEMGNTIKKGLYTKFFGDPNKEDDHGILGFMSNTLSEGVKGWSNAFFGENTDEERENIFKGFMEKAKKNLPSTITGSLIGVGTSVAAGSSVLGMMIGGPMGGAILGAAGSFLARNEKFQNWVFGEKDEDGNRLGGFISKKTQDWFKDNKNHLIGGAAIGVVRGAITGGGILGTLVGGPIAGALLGMATTTVLKSKTFHNFLFGDEENGQKGIFKTLSDAFNRHKKTIDSDNADVAKGLGMGILGGAGGGLSAALIGKVGLFGAMASPAGIIGASLLGLGLSIKAQSKTFKTWLFGAEDAYEYNGEKRKEHGVLGRIGNIINANLLQPLKTNFEFLAKDAMLTVEDTVLTPIKFGAEFVAMKAGDIFYDLKEKAATIASDVGDNVKGFVKGVFAPLTDAVGEAVSGIASFAYSAGKAFVTMPFKVVGKMVDIALSPVMAVARTVGDAALNAVGTVKDFIIGGAAKVLKVAMAGVGGVLKALTWAPRTALGVVGRSFKSVGQGIADWAGDRLVKYNGLESMRNRWSAAKGLNAEKRKELRADRQAARQHNENAKYIAKWTKGQYSEDTEEAREYLKTVNYSRWKAKFGGEKNKDNISITEERERKRQAKEGISVAGMGMSAIKAAPINKLDNWGKALKLIARIADNTDELAENETNKNQDAENEAKERENSVDSSRDPNAKGLTKAQRKERQKKNMEACDNFINMASNGRYTKYSTRAVKYLKENDDIAYSLYVKYTRTHRWPKDEQEYGRAYDKEQKEIDEKNTRTTFDSNSTGNYFRTELGNAKNFLFGGSNDKGLFGRIGGTLGKTFNGSLFDKTKKRWDKFRQRRADDLSGYADNQMAEGGTVEGVTLVGEKEPELVYTTRHDHIINGMQAARELGKKLTDKIKGKQAQAVDDAKTAKEQREEREKAEEKKEEKKFKGGLVKKVGEVANNVKKNGLDFLKSFGKKSLFAIGTGLVASFLIKHPGIVKGAFSAISWIGNKLSEVFSKVGNWWKETGKPFFEDYIKPAATALLGIAGKVGSIFLKLGGETLKDTVDEARDNQENERLTDGKTTDQLVEDNFNQIKKGHLFTDAKGNLNNQSGARARGAAKFVSRTLTRQNTIGKIGGKAVDITKGAVKGVGKVAKGVKNVATKLSGKSIAKGGGEILEEGATSALANIGGKTGGNAVAKVAAGSVDDVAKTGGELAAKGGSKLLKTVLGFVDDFVKLVAEKAGKLIEKFGGKAVGDLASKIFSHIKPSKLKDLITKGFSKISSKISKVTAEHSAGAAVSGGLVNAAFIAISGLNGLTGAARLFHVDQDAVDGKMTAIAGLFGAFEGTLIGSIISIISEFIYDVTGGDFLSNLAVNIYKLIEKDDKAVEALDKARKEFVQDYDQYKEKHLKEQYETQIQAGIIDSSVTFEEWKAEVESEDGKYKASYKSIADYNDEQHSTFLGKVGKKFSKAGKAIKGAVVGKESFTDSKGNKYVKNSDGEYDVINSSGKNIGSVSKEAIPEDAKKGEKGGIVGAVSTVGRAYTSLYIGKKTYTDSQGNIYKQKANGSFDVTDANGKSLGNISSSELPADAKESGRSGGLLGLAKKAGGALANAASSITNIAGQTINNAAKSILGISDNQLESVDPSKLDPASRSAFYLNAIYSSLTGKNNNGNSIFSKLTSLIGSTALHPVSTAANVLSTGSSKLKQLIAARKNTSGTTTTTGGSGEGSYFSQNDSRWGGKKYGTDGATMKDSGCGPAAVAMAVNDARNQDQVDPASMANLAEATGDRDSTGTNWNFVGKASSLMGLNSTQIRNPSGQTLYNQLSSGNPVILSGTSQNNGPYTTAGHYVVANGVDSNGKVKVKDPRGTGYSRSYDINQLAKQTGSSWTIGGGHGKKKKNTQLSGVAATEKAKGKAALKRQQEAAAASSDDYQRWLSIVREVKRQFAEKKMGYSQSRWTDITIGGKTIKMRTDCSGYVTTCMKFYGALPENTGVCSTHSMIRGNSDMEKSGFKAMSWPGWDGLIEGDVLVNPSTHTEIFARNDGGSHYVYNCGSDSSCNSADPTGSSKGSYEIVWRPGAAGEGAVDVDGQSTLGSIANTVSEGLSIFAKIGGALASAGATAFNRILKGDWSNTDYTKEVQNAFSGSSSSDSGDGSTDSGIAAATNLAGGSNAEKVWNFFTGRGYSKAATAGILGNLEQESGVNPTAIQGNGKGPAAGIAQWENYNTKSSRWKALSDYAKSKGKEWTDLGSQLEFIDKELPGLGAFWNYAPNMSKAGTTGTSYEKWKASTDVDTATRQFEGAFERAGTPNMTRRVSAAKGYYNKFSGGGSGYGFGGFGIYNTTLAPDTVPLGTPIITTKDKENAAKNIANDARRDADYAAMKKAKSAKSSKKQYGGYINQQKRALNKRNDPSYGGQYIAKSEKAKGLALIDPELNDGSIGGGYSDGGYAGGSAGGSSVSLAGVEKQLKRIIKILNSIDDGTDKGNKLLKGLKKGGNTILLNDGKTTINNKNDVAGLVSDASSKDNSAAAQTAANIALGNF